MRTAVTDQQEDRVVAETTKRSEAPQGDIHPLDLVDVACEMSCDNKDRIEVWMESGKVAQVSDAQAIEWLEANALMWCVVIRPWILVQPVLADEADTQD